MLLIILKIYANSRFHTIQGILKGWRDEAQGKLPPPLAGRDGDSDNEDGATRHANSDEDDEVEVRARREGTSTTSQAGSPERVAPKKSYFDDIPTSSPGGALERDPDMADEEYELAESLFGSAAPAVHSQAGPSTARAAPSTIAAVRMTTSEAGFNDADLTFDLEEDDFDMDAEAEAEAAMREMDNMNDDFFNSGPSTSKGKGKESDKDTTNTLATAAGVKTNSAMSFYADPKAAERSRTGKSLVQESSRQLPSSSPAPKRHEQDMDHEAHEHEENFDDFDFGDEVDIMREMEQAEKKQRDREAAALAAEKRASAGRDDTPIAETDAATSKTPSLTTSSSAQDVDFDLDDAFNEDFLKDMDEAASISSQKLPASKALEAAPAPASPSKALSPIRSTTTTLDGQIDTPAKSDGSEASHEEDEEDLYS